MMMFTAMGEFGRLLVVSGEASLLTPSDYNSNFDRKSIRIMWNSGLSRLC